ncbi:hypothetical protein [Desulfosudis oleivorans]|uniref:Uncharacterized protein n=1 Tax=Desulfosudis oleivorans (strain DSM 6200 / JCM 39069 / Hxd3) TaxID=96561 RepID=A8ZYL8_DESOH|nr:hypothetical protein [Desulfosudis oleivorans]ABW68743.1 hypothetical protein Dole_2940 [Desulfosudis oleivorans Hxd3]
MDEDKKDVLEQSPPPLDKKYRVRFKAYDQEGNELPNFSFKDLPEGSVLKIGNKSFPMRKDRKKKGV